MNNNEKPIWDKLILYFQDKLSSAERSEIDTWRQESAFNSRMFDEFNSVWKALKSAHNSDKFPVAKAWERFSQWHDKQQKAEHKRHIVKRWLVFARYAAIVILVALVTWGVPEIVESRKKQPPLIVEVSNGQRSIITLFDGTVVTLNSGSQIEYLPEFKNERHVKLEGEAYFSVSKDLSHPFIVETKDFKVKVLGTEFNVKNYASDAQAQTSLIEGSVELILLGNKKLELKPGQQAKIANDGTLKLEQIKNTDRLCAWRYGKYYFEGETLHGIGKILERAFDVKVVFENDLIKNEKYTGSIDVDEHVKDVMERLVLTSLFPLKYEINDNCITLSS